MKIDFVIAWVDGNDPEWLKQKNEYNPSKQTDNSNIRYRDMDILKYWFRAVSEYAPWVNKVHFVTWGHLPEWLDTTCEKLHIVNHKDFIPERFLPTFSSCPIELNLHRIPGLADKFVYFNDDMILNDKVTPEFFFRNGLPCDFAHINNVYNLEVADICSHILINETWATSNHCSYMKVFLKHPLKFINYKYPLKNIIKNILKLENNNVFVGFENHHMAAPYLKEIFNDVWQDEKELMEQTCENKFRSPLDVSQHVFRYRQIATGKFSPVSKKSRGKFLHIGLDNNEIIDAVLTSKYKTLCINDTPEEVDFEKAKKEIVDAYEKKLPHKSCFER